MAGKRAVLILIIIGLIVYFNSLFNGFVWDDEEQVTNNTLVHSITNLPAFFTSSTFNTGGSGTLGGLYYKPLMTTFFAFFYTIFGSNPFFFHLFQVFFHLANSIMVFLVLKYFLDPPDKCNKTSLLPFFLALVFLVHPINTEAVVYVSDLQDILYFFFGMLALLTVLRNNILSFKKLVIISLLLLSSLLSKETGIIFFAIILAFLFLFKRKGIWTYIISIATTLGVYSSLRFAVAGIFFKKHGLSPITVMPFSERLISIPKIIFTYLKTFLFPQNLAINQHWVVRNLSFQDFFLPLITVTLVGAAIIGVALILWRKQKTILPVFLFFFLWFALSLGFHLHIFPLDLTISDRWFYLPMVGVLGMVGTVISRLKVQNSTLRLRSGQEFKVIGILLVILIITGLSVRTVVRNANWKDGLTLYSHDVAISKDSFDLENNLGVELFRAGKLDEAKLHFEKSTILAPNWWTNWNNLGAILERKGDFQKAKEYYKKAIGNGQYYMAYENYASVLLFRDNDPKGAKSFTEESLKVLPYNAKLWLVLSISDYKLDKKEEALKAAQNAYQLSPSQQTYYLYSRLSQNLPLEFK